ncbi:hypothetical protein [Capnocytophaga sp. oral taxon 864]|uniref:hypothetical protein n=1 Tax=Capnocytophaga sp. oral taxon 864 TaxID=1316593 RepID=UPI000D038204|nr:hypothetical protein [Capnocytophaga sp. oral taxon 864]AVM54779.1 hypothetical protein C3V44_03515 [Capnocytophaga sp. oral taxon 864]
MEKELKNFTEKSCEKLKNAIQEIANEEDKKEVYALSFCYTCDDDDLRFPKITLGYNTLSNVKEESYNATSKEDAKWNFDYWLQTEVETVGGKKDKLLKQWFAKTPYFYSDEENDRAIEEDEELYDKLLKKGDKFGKDFIKEVIALAKRLLDDGEVEKVFGRNIPIIIHQRDFEDTPISWTKKANSAKLIKEFLEYWDGDGEEED